MGSQEQTLEPTRATNALVGGLSGSIHKALDLEEVILAAELVGHMSRQ